MFVAEAELSQHLHVIQLYNFDSQQAYTDHHNHHHHFPEGLGVFPVP